MQIKKILDNYSIQGNELNRELFYKFDNNLVKIIVDRNCNNYDIHIKVLLIDKAQVSQVQLLFYESEKLLNSKMPYNNINKALELNNEDITNILKDIERILQ